MKNRLLFVAGLATGYVVGSRAGRSAYTALAERLQAIRSTDAVRSAVGSVTQAVQAKAPGLTAAVSQVAETTGAVAEAAASAPDPEQEESGSTAEAEPSEDAGTKEPSGSAAGGSSTGAAKPKRPSRSRAAAGGTPESAEEAAQAFEEQLPESGGAIDDAASSIAPASGQADEARNPTATS